MLPQLWGDEEGWGAGVALKSDEESCVHETRRCSDASIDFIETGVQATRQRHVPGYDPNQI